MSLVKLALDWTPNTNHTGFFVAKQKGFYEDLGIDVEITDPSRDNYQFTPAKKLIEGMVDFAITPSESIISLHTKKSPVHAIAVAAILKEDVSAIVSLESSGIKRPKDLDGKVYASYGARYEDKIVKEMIINDGGKGDIEVIYPEKLRIWEVLLTGKADATWVFLNWEGVDAETQGLPLNAFIMADYHIPYGYSPVLTTREDLVREKKVEYLAFLKATRKGFLYAQQEPEEAVEILSPFVPEDQKENMDLLKCQIATAAYYGNERNWGIMESDRVEDFLSWLKKNDLEEKAEKLNKAFCNILLKEMMV